MNNANNVSNNTRGLYFDSISKSFGGTQALRDVSLAVNRGDVVALLGENGAGKSTLIKILGGIHTSDSGQVLIDGQPYQHQPGRFDQPQAVAFIHQDLGLIEWMSIAENMALAQGFVRSKGLIRWRQTEDFARKALTRVGCDFDPDTRVQSLSRTEKSLVAIARALAVDSEFLVLDEPTASLPADEVERLFTALRPLRERGVGMIYVSHRLDEIFRIADRVSVLRDGQLVGERNIADTNPRELVQLIVGKETQAFNKQQRHTGQNALTVRALQTNSTGPVDFDVHKGEMVGLVGLRGAGQDDVSRALFGEIEHSGSITFNGDTPQLGSPQQALESGIGLVARDRIVESVAPSLSIRENTFLNPAGTGRTLFTWTWPWQEKKLSRELGQRVGLYPNDPQLPIEALSGGNQQKVVIGRWLACERPLLIAEDPTAGVDVGAKADIYALLDQTLAAGTTVIIVSTDFEEVAAICDRALVFSQGQLVETLTGKQITVAALIEAASAKSAPTTSAA